MRNKINACICNAITLLNQTLESKLPIDKGKDCPLYADNAMDSISLVTLISLVEQAIEDEFEKPIILANEKAMSQRNSPFLTIGTLSDYIVKLLEEERK